MSAQLGTANLERRLIKSGVVSKRDRIAHQRTERIDTPEATTYQAICTVCILRVCINPTSLLIKRPADRFPTSLFYSYTSGRKQPSFYPSG